MDILKKTYLKYSPIKIFSVFGNSMNPSFTKGQRLIGLSTILSKPKILDVVICRDPRTKKLILKRVKKIRNNKYFVEGDNKKNSTDSSIFGWLENKDILAKIIYPKTVYNT